MKTRTFIISLFVLPIGLFSQNSPIQDSLLAPENRDLFQDSPSIDDGKENSDIREEESKKWQESIESDIRSGNALMPEAMDMELNIELRESLIESYKNASLKSTMGEPLLRAREMDPDNTDILDELMGYYEIKGDQASMEEIATEMTSKNKYASEIVNYQASVLSNIEANSILITNGEWDTYPSIGLQSTFAKDIVIVNLNLLEDTEYCTDRLTQKGLIVPAYQANQKAQFISALEQQNSDRAFYLGLTVDKAILRELKNDLQLAGLTFRYRGKIDPGEMATFWRKHIDKKALEQKAATKTLCDFKLNYLPMMSALKLYHRALGNDNKAAELDRLMRELLAQAGKSQLIKSLE